FPAKRNELFAQLDSRLHRQRPAIALSHERSLSHPQVNGKCNTGRSITLSISGGAQRRPLHAER
ncbi:MAG: hypothetical protein K8F56_08620, partial [Rhodocyclaceae bacterium]|nr:hypothetical protein [Rhodocyclaceae bacterium]